MAAQPQSSSIDPKSPFYLHPSDHPGLVFVTHPLSDEGENYFVWKKAFLNALKSKNKAGFVDGTIVTPEPSADNYAQWQQCNAIVLSWLSNALSKELQGAATHADTARVVWLDLEERFSQGVDARVYELRRTVAGLRQKQSTVSAYYGRLKAAWGELQSFELLHVCTCGKCTCAVTKAVEKLREKEMVFDFLMGLDESFNNVRSHVLSIDPLPSIGRVYALVAQEEKQRSVARNLLPQFDAAAMAAVPSSFPKRSTSAPAPSKGERSRCSHCGKAGHLREKCYNLIGFSSDWRSRRPRGAPPSADQSIAVGGGAVPSPGHSVFAGLTAAQQNQVTQLLEQFKDGAPAADASALPSASLPPLDPGKLRVFSASSVVWILDSGASAHITHDPGMLFDVTRASPRCSVTTSNGHMVPVRAMGSVSFPHGLSLKHVLVVPEFKFKLLSISQLSRDLNCAVTFWMDVCLIQEMPSKKLIGVGRLHDGLYYLDSGTPSFSPSATFSLATVHNKETTLWHRRLGHLPLSRFRFLSVGSSVSDTQFCDACCRAKQTRLPFPLSTSMSANNFDLIHCDIWGPYPTPTLSRAHYFLTIVDDHSRYTWVYLMAYKSDTQRYLLHFFNWVRNSLVFPSKLFVLIMA